MAIIFWADNKVSTVTRDINLEVAMRDELYQGHMIIGALK